MFDFENVMILQRGRGITGQYGSNGRAPQRKRGMDKTNIYIYIYMEDFLLICFKNVYNPMFAVRELTF